MNKTYTLQSPKTVAERVVGKVLGGKGSGHHGHSGLENVHGGSSSSGGGKSPKKREGIKPVQRLQKEYRGIKEITFVPQEGKHSEQEIIDNKKVIDDTISAMGEEHTKEMNALYVTSGTFTPMGAGTYIPITKDKGYVSDEILLQQAWLDKDYKGRKHLLAHEIAHRAMLTSKKELYKKFRGTGLGKKYIGEMSASASVQKSHVDGEVFAEAYARFKLKIDQPDELNNFFKENE